MIRRTLTLTLFIASALGSIGRAHQAAPMDWRAVVATMERAVLADDIAGIKQSRTELLRSLSTTPAGDDAVMIRYAIAYAGWRMSTSPAVPSREQNDLLDNAEDMLKAALKLQPKSAECSALLSSVYGIKIAHSSIKGIVLGPRSSHALDDALKAEPQNPRVLVAQGVSKFNSPSMFGGSDKDAENILREAIQRFSSEPADKPFPNWGRFDAHAWLGQVLAKRGDKDGARAEYALALQAAPQSGWVKYVLIPALDKPR